MKEKLAKELFHGKENLNCTQSVLKAYQEEYNISDELIETARRYGGGRAENGVCGALYAIKLLLKNSNLNIYNDMSKILNEHADSIYCEEIKSKKKLSCRDCVGLMAKKMSGNFE